MSTTAANAYVQPLVAEYLRPARQPRARARARRAAAHHGVERRLHLGRSRGRDADPAARIGAGGRRAFGAQHRAQQRHRPDPRVRHGRHDRESVRRGRRRAARSRTASSARACSRFKRGSGLPILIPSIDLIEIGAGGGSIAHVNDLGLLNVGPESAGADPGPACYGQGGTERDGDRRRPRAGLSQRRQLPRRRDEAQARPRARRRSQQARRAAEALARPKSRGASATSSTRTWPPRRASTSPRKATTRASSRWSRRAARAPCTWSRSRASSRSRACWRRSPPAPARASASWRRRRAWTALVESRSGEGHRLEARREGVCGAARRRRKRARIGRGAVESAALKWWIGAEMRYAGQGHNVSVSLPWRRDRARRLESRAPEGIREALPPALRPSRSERRAAGRSPGGSPGRSVVKSHRFTWGDARVSAEARHARQARHLAAAAAAVRRGRRSTTAIRSSPGTQHRGPGRAGGARIDAGGAGARRRADAARLHRVGYDQGIRMSRARRTRNSTRSRWKSSGSASSAWSTRPRPRSCARRSRCWCARRTISRSC